MLTGLAFAKQPKTYDLTGTVVFESFHSDSEAHVTVNGERYDSYCSTDAASTTCTDSAGVFYVALADGNKYTFIHLLEFPNQCCDDPILHAKRKQQSASFQYRVHPHLMGVKDGSVICAPFTNDKGKDKDKEACYQIQRIMEVAPLPRTGTYNQADIDRGVEVYGFTPQQSEERLKQNGFVREQRASK